MELFKGGAIAMVFKFLSIIIGFVFIWLLTKWVGADGYGIFSTCWTILMIGTVLGKLGFDTSIIKFISGSIGKKDYHHVKPIYKSSMLIVFVCSSIVSIILFIFSGSLSQLFFETRIYTNLIRVIALTVIPLTLMNINAESLKSLKNITAFSIFQNWIIYLVTLAILFLLSFKQLSKDSSIYSLGIATFLVMIISFWIVKINFSRLPKAKSNRKPYKFNLRKTLSISTPMMLTNSLFLVMSWMDILMLSAFKDDAAVGSYNTALKISAVVSTALIAINSIAMPKFAELYSKNDKNAFRLVVKQTSLLNFIIAVPIFVIILIFPEFLLGIFGEEFIICKDSLIILALGQLFCAFSGSTIHVLNMTGKEKAAKNIILATSILNFGLNYILVPPYGVTGASIATAISMIFWNILAELVVYKHLNFLTYPIFSFSRIKELKNSVFPKV